MSDTHTIKGTSNKETESAMLVELEDGTGVWLPFSQIHGISREGQGNEVTVIVSRWIAEKKGLL